MGTGQRLRERRLGGLARAGERGRAEARRRQWEFVRREWRHLVVLPIVAGVVLTLALIFVTGGFQRGLIVGGVVVGVAAALAAFVLQATGTAAWGMGALAEEMTARELRPLRAAGWRVVHHFSLRRGDIDHVLVGPGGVIAVETKWSAEGWRLTPPDGRILAAVEQVRSGAKALRLWYPLRSLGVHSVDSVVFLWGGGPDHDSGHRSPGVCRLDEVAVVVGLHSAELWRAEVSKRSAREEFDPAQVHDLWSALEHQAAIRDQRESEVAPAPPTLLRLYNTLAVNVIVAMLAFWLCLELLSFLDSWWLWGLGTLLLAGVGWFARRATGYRLPALAWITGLAAAWAVVAASAVDAALT